MNEEERKALAKLVEEQMDKALKPFLQIKRPEGDTDDRSDVEKLFPSLGEFVRDVACRDLDEGSAKRCKEYATKEMSMDSDPAGGYLIPIKYREGLLQFSPEEAIVRPRAFVIPAGSPPDAALEMPLLEQAGLTDQEHGDLYGGIWFCWTSEGDAKYNTEIRVSMVEYKPNEWSGYCVLTDKVLRNAKQLEAIVKQKYREGLIGFEDYHFLLGTGVGQPMGVIHSPCTVEVTRAGTDAIVFADITGMLDVFLGESRAVWVINKACRSQIIALVDANGNSIWIQGNIAKKIPDVLCGIPIKWTYKVPALGTRGDIGLYDFSKYIIKDGFGPAFDKSKHVYFLSNKTALKMFGNVDGKPWLKGSLTADDNVTEISPFVVLNTDTA